MKHLLLPLLALLALSALLTGCAFDQKVRKRAAFDFDCPKDKIEVTEIDTLTYGAEGCQTRGTYVIIEGKPILNNIRTPNGNTQIQSKQR